MSIIFKVARAELRNLFFSPVAWVLAIIFMIQCAVIYTDVLYLWSKSQEMFIQSPRFEFFAMSLTRMLFVDGGFFRTVAQNLYLFIPLLTMGILSREISSGSIKLLYSSPIKTRHIVFGKYLALMIFSLLLLLIMGVFLTAGYFNIKDADYGLLLAASLGLYLLICAYMAIGFFMSSITTYQIVAAIGTFAVIFILGKIGGLWQEIDFVRDLTYFLSMSGRATKMIDGLITSKDVFYFLIIIGMFLGFTLLKLKSGRQPSRWYITLSKCFAVLMVAVLMGYTTSRPGLVAYYDATASQANTLHPNIQKVVKEFGDAPLEVTLYTNLLGENLYFGIPAARNRYLTDLWEKYIRFKPNIEFKYEYYYDAAPDSYLFKVYPTKTLQEIASDEAIRNDFDLADFKSPEAMRATINLAEENYQLVMQLKYNGKTTFLRTFKDPKVWPDDELVAAALARVLDKQMPTVLFLTGNLERDIHVKGEAGFFDYTLDRGNRGSLINYGFDLDTISLETNDIPQDTKQITALVVADPKIALGAVTQQKINNYIEEGGNVMILGEPKKTDHLNPILKPLGVQLMSGTLIKVSTHQKLDRFGAYVTKPATYLSDAQRLILQRNARAEDTTFINGESIAPIEILETGNEFVKTPLLVTQPDVWLKRGVLVNDSTPPLFNAQEGDLRADSFTTTMGLSRKINNKEQRIVVAGDVDFLTNKYKGGEYIFLSALISWLDFNKYPVYAPVAYPGDNLIIASSNTAGIFKKLFVWIMPAMVLLMGVIIIVRRKRK